MRHESSKGDSNLDQTIQWARESLRRRRSELLEKKKSLIESYKDDEFRSSATSPTDVNSMLERGRALLAEAEAHSEILGQYAAGSANINSSAPRADELDQATVASRTVGSRSIADEPSEGEFMSRFLQDTNHGGNRYDVSKTAGSRESPYRIAHRLPVETPDWGNDDGGEKMLSRQEGRFEGNEELQELLREGEARARLDELIATVRRQGDDLPTRTDLEDTPPKKIASFDPSSMKAARRAALKKIKLEEEIAAAEEEARRLTSFKALPLPGGAEVKNNLFAPTQSFQGKQIGSVEKLVRRDTKCDLNDTSSSISGTFGTLDGISMVSSRTSQGNSFDYHGCENEADKERARHLRLEKKMKKRQLLDAVNQIIMDDMEATSLADDDVRSVFSEGCDIVEDPSKLRQDIARLEAKLKQKKTQRLATLNDIVDIDLNTLFDRLLSRETGDDMRHIIDRLKDQVYGSVNDFHIVPHVKEIGSQVHEQHRKRSLYRRHEEWAKEREQRLFHARIQSEADAMDGITGRPELSHATRSWKRAKESHDETLRKFAEVEERKRLEKEEKERAADEAKMKEMEELQRQANARLRSMKSEVDREEQVKRLEALSRPRQTREVPIIVESTAGEDQPHHTPKSKIFLPAKPEKTKLKSPQEKLARTSLTTNPMPTKTPDDFCGMTSFSEMSEKEFRKLVKRIEGSSLILSG